MGVTPRGGKGGLLGAVPIGSAVPFCFFLFVSFLYLFIFMLFIVISFYFDFFVFCFVLVFLLFSSFYLFIFVSFFPVSFCFVSFLFSPVSFCLFLFLFASFCVFCFCLFLVVRFGLVVCPFVCVGGVSVRVCLFGSSSCLPACLFCASVGASAGALLALGAVGGSCMAGGSWLCF